MSLRSFSSICTLLLLHFHPLFSPHTFASAAGTAGSLNLYNDYGCNTPSALNPTVSLALSTCLVTTGGEGLIINTYPPCPGSGNASLIYYRDAACGTQNKNIDTSIFADNCWQLADGQDLFNAKAVMFSCQPAANNPRPSSTSTAVVSALAAVATGSGDSGSGSGSGSGSASSTTSAAGASPSDTTSSGKNSSAGGSGSSSSSSSNGGSNTNTNTNTVTTASPSTSSSGLDTGDIIAISVGLGIGLPTIAIMLATWLFPDFRHKLKRWIFGAAGKAHHQLPLNHSHSDQRPFAHELPYNGSRETETRQMY